MADVLVVGEERSHRSLVPTGITLVSSGWTRAQQRVPEVRDIPFVKDDVEVVSGLATVRAGEDEVGRRNPPADASQRV